MSRKILGTVAGCALALLACNRPSISNASDSNVSGDPAGQKPAGDYGSVDQPGTSPSGAQTGAAADTKAQAQGWSDNAAAASDTNIVGTVRDTGSGSLTLDTNPNGQIRLSTGDFTTFLDASGKKLGSDALKEGDQVRAAYRMDGSDKKAEQIQVVSGSALPSSAIPK